MTGTRVLADRPSAARHALVEGRTRAAHPHPNRMVGAPAMLALQRKAGNSAVSALMAAKFRRPDEKAVGQIDGALRELRRDEPAIDTVETGLKAAKAAGIPVDLEGVKPPAAALAVTTTGFGPGSVPAKKPVPPPKPVPKVSPLGRAAAKGGPAPKGGPKAAGPGPAAAPKAGAPAGPAALSGDQLRQPPAPPRSVRPEQDSAFKQVTGGVKGFAKDKRAHPPAASKAKEAQDAALPPTGDVAGQAKAAKVDTMDAQRPGTFDKKSFIAAVKTAIEAKSPKTLKEADDYKASGKAGEVKGEVKGLVTAGKEGQTQDIETATEAPPDQSKAVPKTVTAMGPEAPGNTIVVPADGSVPKRAPPEQLNLAAGKAQADQELADAEVTEGQLAKSNEPQFEQALTDKKAAATHADTAPGDFRKAEGEVLDQNKAEAKATAADGIAGMQGAKGAALAKLVADKGKAKTKDEAKRAEVTTKIDQIFTTTEGAVKKILDGIDPLVEKEFNAGEARARATFESYVAAKMSAYKKDRYGGWLGGLRWAKDKLVGMPAKVNEFYTAGREIYLQQMDGVISRVADIVGNNLVAAKQRIAAGRTEIATYVKSLPKDLQKVGSEASKEIGERFSQLESDVDEKQNAVVDTLATKYVEARKGLDERIEALQAENKGLVDKAIDGIKAVINTIRELVGMLKNVLARVAGVVGDIIKDPIGFLGNLIAGIKGGIAKFADNILDHLRKGLMSWLFGALAEGGIELPDTFDIKGIIKLLASIFGLTWANIRNRIVKQIGEPAMGAIEKGVEIFSVLATQGVGGLWQMLLEKLGDIKEMILEQVKDFVITKIITAGITWLIGLLNPAAAFIKACKLIYDVVMFFVNNAARIKAFVDTIIDATGEVVKGNIGGVINKINDVLGKMVPILIGFLASVIGLGGIGEKIRSIIQKLQKPVNAALDFVIKKGLQLAAPIIRGLKNVSKKVKAKVAAGKAYVKGKVDAGKKYVKGKIASVKAKAKARGDAKAADVKAAAQRGAARGWQAASGLTRAQVVKEPDLKAALRAVERGATGPRVRLDVVQSGDAWRVKAEATQGRQRATVDQGAGWIARSERGAPSFAAANLTSFNQGLAREVMSELRRSEAQPSAGGLRAEYDRKVAAARRLESSAQSKLNGRMRGLTLAVKQEPFAGAERDKQIKTTVTVSPNSTVLTEDDPLGGATADADFPFAVDKAGSQGKIAITRVGRALQFLRQIKIPLRGRDPSVGYVVNMLALPDQAPADIASRYLDDGWSGAGADNVAAARTAVVVGINRARSVDPAKDAEARSAISGAVSGVARDGKLLMAAFGMMWTPAWKNTKTNKAASLAEVRRAAAASPVATQKALEQEAGLRDKGALPYGALREEVLNSSYTRKATEILSKVNDQVYMLTQDADGGAKAASGSGIFKAYDEVLAAAKNNPHLVIGGYTFEGFNWAADAPKRTVQLTTLANQLDRAIREVVGRKHPQALYPTEPSLLIKVWDRAHLDEAIFQHPKINEALGKRQGSFFGLGASEGRAAETSMAEAMGPGNLRVVHDPRASVTTSPAPNDPTRGFAVTEGGVRAHAAGERQPGARDPEARDPMYAVIMQSQSHASAVRLAQEFRRSNPALGSGDQQQMETYIFDAVEDITMLLAKDPQLTAGSPQVAARVARLDAKAQEIVARRGRGAPERGQGLQEAHQLTKDIISALTADQLKGYWTRLSALLAEIMGAGGGAGGGNS